MSCDLTQRRARVLAQGPGIDRDALHHLRAAIAQLHALFEQAREKPDPPARRDVLRELDAMRKRLDRLGSPRPSLGLIARRQYASPRT